MRGSRYFGRVAHEVAAGATRLVVRVRGRLRGDRLLVAAAFLVLLFCLFGAWKLQAVNVRTDIPTPEITLSLDPAPQTQFEMVLARVSLRVRPRVRHCGWVDVADQFHPASPWYFSNTRNWPVLGQDWAPKVARFGIAILTPRPVTDVQVALASNGYLFRPGQPPVVDSRPVPALVSSAVLEPSSGSNYLEQSFGGTIRSWPTHRAALRLTFKAPWAVRRGFGTCHVVAPRLLDTSAGGDFALEQAGGKREGSLVDHIGSAETSIPVESGVVASVAASGAADSVAPL